MYRRMLQRHPFDRPVHCLHVAPRARREVGRGGRKSAAMREDVPDQHLFLAIAPKGWPVISDPVVELERAPLDQEPERHRAKGLGTGKERE